ncbi:MAG TPA: glycosyltransferase family 4 protein [Pyrinomonadaceae bacterium]|nr:glycosyltransferase family 4 protein [Pyrinomonadaceae bacterium]
MQPDVGPTKVLLLTLDGNETRARAMLEKRFPGTSIVTVPRSTLESQGVLKSLAFLRSQRADVFVLSMENLSYQRGQNLLTLFGALSGARQILALDSHGQTRVESSGASLTRAPFRLLQESSLSGQAIVRSYRDLRRLEQAVKAPRTFKSRDSGGPLQLVFLRATPGPGTQAGGASSHINGFIKAAVRAGVNVRLLTNDYIAGFDETVPMTLIPLQPKGITRSAFDLYNNLVFTHGAEREIRRIKPDLIYQRYGRFTWAGVSASLTANKPLFLEYNGSEVWVGRYWDSAGMFPLLERFERLNLEAAARIFVVSEVERQNLLRIGVPDGKIVFNPNGVDAEKFRPNIGGAFVRNELGIKPNEVLTGFVGSFGPWHGVLELARAITRIPPDVPLKFLLIGAGKLRDETERLVKEAGVGERVIFTGSLAHERVPTYLDACDILVSPHVPLEDGSDFFGSPTKLFEYMAMGKGIVASRLGQIGDVLVHERNALLVEPKHIEELSDALIRLAGSRELRDRLGHQARFDVEDKYTWNHNAQRVLAAYYEWLEQN